MSDAIRREAACCCGALRVTTRGEPVRISICHCLECQRRTGSVFGAQARFREEDVEIAGASTTFVRTGDEGTSAEMHFCPTCGSTVYYRPLSLPGFIGVPVGGFGDPSFPAPYVSVYEARRHGWVAPICDAIAERYD